MGQRSKNERNLCRRFYKGTSKSVSSGTPTYEAITKSYEDFIYTHRTCQLMATYIKTMLKLAFWMGIQLFAGTTMASKAMRECIPPSYVKPTKPSKKRRVKKEDGTETKKELNDKE